jgi:hypothetical protein
MVCAKEEDDILSSRTSIDVQQVQVRINFELTEGIDTISPSQSEVVFDVAKAQKYGTLKNRDCNGEAPSFGAITDAE